VSVCNVWCAARLHDLGDDVVLGLHILKTVLLSYASKHVLFAALLHLTSEQEFVQYEVCLLKVEDDIELADIAVVLVHLLNVAMDNLESDQLVVCGITSGDEEERGISAVHDLCVFVLEKIAHAGTAGEDELRDIFDDLGFVLGREGGEPFG